MRVRPTREPASPRWWGRALANGPGRFVPLALHCHLALAWDRTSGYREMNEGGGKSSRQYSFANRTKGGESKCSSRTLTRSRSDVYWYVADSRFWRSAHTGRSLLMETSMPRPASQAHRANGEKNR